MNNKDTYRQYGYSTIKVLLLIVFTKAMVLFSQDYGHVYKELELRDHYYMYVKFRGDNAIYYVRKNRSDNSLTPLKKYEKTAKNTYVYSDTTSIKEVGNFRDFNLYNNPFKKQKRKEKIGVWKEYDSITSSVKTIDYSNPKAGEMMRIRLFPRGSYTYIKSTKKQKSDK